MPVGMYFRKQIIIIIESYGHKNDFDIKNLYEMERNTEILRRRYKINLF